MQMKDYFSTKILYFLHMSKICSTFAPANSRRDVCVIFRSEGADILIGVY